MRDLAGKSGVYMIREKGLFSPVVYIGESHTGRLKKTLLRHFQSWKSRGPTYARSKVEVSVIVTAPKSAVGLQNDLIRDHNPRDNQAEKPDFWV